MCIIQNLHYKPAAIQNLQYKFLHTDLLTNICYKKISAYKICIIQNLHYKPAEIQNLQYKFLHTESAYKFLLQKNFCIQNLHNKKSALQTCCNTESTIQISAYRICLQISTAKKFLHTKSA